MALVNGALVCVEDKLGVAVTLANVTDDAAVDMVTGSGG